MVRLIDADTLLKRMQKDPLFDLVERYGVSGVINAEPTVDAEPVRHGYWRNYKDEHTCSCCGETVTGDWYDQDNDAYWVCPWCGAWMDVERKEE